MSAGPRSPDSPRRRGGGPRRRPSFSLIIDGTFAARPLRLLEPRRARVLRGGAGRTELHRKLPTDPIGGWSPKGSLPGVDLSRRSPGRTAIGGGVDSSHVRCRRTACIPESGRRSAFPGDGGRPKGSGPDPFRLVPTPRRSRRWARGRPRGLRGSRTGASRIRSCGRGSRAAPRPCPRSRNAPRPLSRPRP